MGAVDGRWESPNFLDHVKMLKNKESGDFYHHSLWGVLGVRVNLGYLYGPTFEAGYDKKKVRINENTEHECAHDKNQNQENQKQKHYLVVGIRTPLKNIGQLG